MSQQALRQGRRSAPIASGKCAHTVHGSTASLVSIQLLSQKRVERLPVLRRSKERAKQSVSESLLLNFPHPRVFG